MVYRTYERAESRVFALVAAIGVWPGIVACAGGWRLTCDPQVGEVGRHGYLLY